MAKIITRTNNTIQANRFLVGKAREAFITLVTENNGIIDKATNGFYKATFEDKTDATYVARMLNERYDEHNVRMPEPTKAKGKTEPKKAKGSTLDFTQFKGTKSEKNRALHAMLVAKGITNSKTAEYQAVWNARPWAK